MTQKFVLTMLAALALAGAGMFGSASQSLAQTAQDFSGTATDLSAQANQQNKGKDAPPKAGPRNAGPQNAGPRNVGPPNIGQRNIAPRNIGQRNIGQRNIRQRNIGQSNIRQRNIGQQNIRQRSIGPRSVGQRNINQPRRALSGVSIRGASRATIAGRNYSVWRGRHRARHGGRWRTFVGLGALGAIAFGSAYYYPYAYIDAPAPFCDGLTEDGCQLQWQEVPTLEEGPPVFQCVAYCPWQ
jgi:hypothetical protein